MSDIEETPVVPQVTTTEEADTRIGRDDPFQFGQRTLTSDDDVWKHNAWDNVEWGQEQVLEAEEKIKKQYENPVDDFDKHKYNSDPARYWDIFYKNNRENFFKDRKWLQIEFPTLYESTKEDAGPVTIFEIGCGAGNTMFPILNENKNPDLRVIGADYSKRAVELVKTSEHFNPEYAHACVWDLANPEGALPEGVEPHSVDIAVMIFVFSALSPEQWKQGVENLAKVMKPGGQILFRDYGRYDLAQVRFKKGRLLDDNFYIRGDGTRVYFFTEEELRQIFTERFEEEKIGTDRRLIVNRKRQLKMYRIWLQAVFNVPK
ncbi:CYFA0S14e01992g1_1 [Cyberlindnera fabianii]|uniref:tRNA N(3)-methylcytidine methyltransferase n=1 Tax=Cyberlindnera fabianii TaxID=36022 RepID=A0A061B3D5_CYBFA|nr:Methyltransferase-like protein [Cyberlindnera fabianii]CDR44340.1 CYFA0S14e01992g1_1 [Cyberlindnera fabianii]